MTAIDELRKLPPEERIKKLEEMAERDKKEIEEAQKMIKDSEDEASEEQKKIREIPVPQMRAIDINQLFSPEEKEMFRQKRLVAETHPEEEQSEKPEVPEAIKDLEETVAQETPQVTDAQLQEQQQYVNQLATERTATSMYEEMSGIASDARDRGYLSQTHQDRLENLYRAMMEKNDAIKQGEYDASKTVSQDIAASLDLFKSLKKNYIQ